MDANIINLAGAAIGVAVLVVGVLKAWQHADGKTKQAALRLAIRQLVFLAEKSLPGTGKGPQRKQQVLIALQRRFPNLDMTIVSELIDLAAAELTAIQARGKSGRESG